MRRQTTILILILFAILLLSFSASAKETACDGYTVSVFNGIPACTNDGMLHICPVNFPDVNFRAYLLSTIPEAGDMLLTEVDISQIHEISCSFRYIDSLQGIAYFTNLRSLECAYNDLTSLDLSNNPMLTKLYCRGNQLQTLIIPGSRLEEVNCDDNLLRTLDLSKAVSLRHLTCNNNRLDILLIRSCTNLDTLECSKNRLTALDVSNLAKLRVLNCQVNSIRELNLGTINEITVLDCSNNSLTQLDIQNLSQLQTLRCDYNSLTQLNLSVATKLEHLSCHNNKITSLNLSNLPNLSSLVCRENCLTDLDLSVCLNLTTVDIASQYADLASQILVNQGQTTCAVNISNIVRPDRIGYVAKVASLSYPNRLLSFDQATGIAVFAKYAKVILIYIDLPCPSPNLEKQPEMRLTVQLSCPHSWAEPTCSYPQKCTVCGETRGNTLPHNWMPATATSPEICSDCGKKTGHPLEHIWLNAECERPEHCKYCDETRGDPLGHDYADADTCKGLQRCRRCKETKDVTVSHNLVEGKNHMMTCTLCGYQTKEYNPEHTWVRKSFFSPLRCKYCGKAHGPSFFTMHSLLIFLGIYILELAAAAWYLIYYYRVKRKF